MQSSTIRRRLICMATLGINHLQGPMQTDTDLDGGVGKPGSDSPEQKSSKIVH